MRGATPFAGHCLRHPVFCTPARADEMAMSNPAVAGASDTKHIGMPDCLSECNEMNAGEMAMMNSCLMPFGIMTGEAGKWMVGYQFTHKKMGDFFSAVWRQFC
jgi:hypothetical protein